MPAWNDVTRLFERNPTVVFADIDLSVASPTLRGPDAGDPGADGWPCIRYFNQETGVFGGSYQKLTSLPICRELGEEQRMIDYVEEYGRTVLCALNGENCTDKELKFIEKWKGMSTEEVKTQLRRLEEMIAKPMNDDLREWAIRRTRLLKKVIQMAPRDRNSPVETSEL